MKHFLLTKSSSLLFIEKEYTKEEIVPDNNQVRHSNGKTNSKLIRCSDGYWYIKNGNNMYRLKGISTREVCISKLTETGGNIVAKINKKWFLEIKK